HGSGTTVEPVGSAGGTVVQRHLGPGCENRDGLSQRRARCARSQGASAGHQGSLLPPPRGRNVYGPHRQPYTLPARVRTGLQRGGASPVSPPDPRTDLGGTGAAAAECEKGP